MARRALADKLYEKRKTGALEVERLVRAALAEAPARADANAEAAEGDADAPRRAILGLVSLLAEDFAAHENPNRRKGGLLGLAAVVVGLGERGIGETDDDRGAADAADTARRRNETHASWEALRAAAAPVLAAFRDPEPRVRYYACEAMYNVLKTARAGLLLMPVAEGEGDGEGPRVAKEGEDGSLAFPVLRALFDGLCDLSADADADVQNAAHLLDGLLKDVVSEAFHDADGPEDAAGRVVSDASACLVSAIRARADGRASRPDAPAEDPYARQFLIGWIVALDATPQVDALVWLPAFFDGLLRMLSDPNREIRQQADGCLRTFLSEIRALFEATGADADRARLRRVDVARLSATLEKHTRSADEFTRVTAVTWLREFVALAGREGGRREDDHAARDETRRPRAAPSETRAGPRRRSFARVAEMTRAVLPCLSHAEAKVRDVAARAAEELLEAACDAAAANTLDLDALLAALAACAGVAPEAPPPDPRDEGRARRVPVLSRDPSRLDAVAGEATRAEALRWYLALLETAPEETRARMLGVERDGTAPPGSRGAAPREAEADAAAARKDAFFSSDALTSVFLNVSSDSELATRRATDALARLGEGSDHAFDTVARALARALFEDEKALSSGRRTRPRGRSRHGPRADVAGVDESAPPPTANAPSAETSGGRPTFLERRGLATIRRLCAVLGDARVVRRLAEVVAEMAAPILERAGSREDDDDGARDDDDDDDGVVLAFVANAADALNAIALAAPECARLRRTLRGDDDAFTFAETRDVRDGAREERGVERVVAVSEKETLLRGLFPCWCHSPAATIGLCVLSGLDATAFFCAERIARDESELSRDALVRLDRLVHLLETPPFAGARTRLIVPGARPHLRRALAAVLALLPQSSAFRLLRDRLGACALASGRDESETSLQELLGQARDIDAAVPPFAARAFRAARAAHARERARTSDESSRVDRD